MTSIRSLAGLVLVLGFVHSSWQVPLQEEDSSSFGAKDALLDEQLSNLKRHSEGTFSNDYSKYLEDRKAQDFVRWLVNNKRSGHEEERHEEERHEEERHKKLHEEERHEERRHADGTFTSDVSSFLQDQAVKDFVARLKAGQARRASEAALSRRHVDGSFTSDVNKVLDSMAAKEYLLWVMTSKPAGDRRRRQAAQ